MRFYPILLATMLCIFSVQITFGQTDSIQLSIENEQRARVLFKQLRCVVCQNQSIDGSDADVAKDLRQIVREQIQSGKSNSDIIEFLVSRYGEFILLKPAFAWHTMLLWLSPVVFLLFGLGVVLIFRKQNIERSEKTLSDDEERRLSEILNNRE